MQDLGRFAVAANLKRLLLVALAALSVTQAYLGLRAGAASADRLLHWNRHPALIASTAGEGAIEIEVAQAVADGIPGVARPEYPTPYEPGNTRILVPRPPAVPLQPLTEVMLLQNPGAPAEVTLLSHIGLWAPAVAALVNVGVLLLLARWLLRAPWGEDVTWRDGNWVATGQSGQAPGMRADPAQALREPRESRKATAIWTVLFGSLTLLWIALVPRGQRGSADALLPAFVFGALSLLAGFTLLQARSRTLAHDVDGLCETTFFGARRVRWDDIARVVRRNVNEDAQRRYDRSRRRSGSRPQTIYVHELQSEDGTAILALAEVMVPALAYEALLRRAAGNPPLVEANPHLVRGR